MYPKTVKINNKNLMALLKQKGEVVEKGRILTSEIEEIEKSMIDLDKEVVKIEEKVPREDLDEEAKKITEEFNALSEKATELQKKLSDRLSQNVPQESKRIKTEGFLKTVIPKFIGVDFKSSSCS